MNRKSKTRDEQKKTNRAAKSSSNIIKQDKKHCAPPAEGWEIGERHKRDEERDMVAQKLRNTSGI